MRKFLVLLAWIAPLGAWAADSTRLELDLGLGLAYVRVHELPGDLPTAPERASPVVLDLRYAKGGASAAHALAAWVQFRSTPRTPVIVLVNADTAPELLNELDAGSATRGLVSIGTASSRYVPDIAVKVASATERAAYDALEKGTPVAKLLADNPDKPRHDEAEIAKEHSDAAAAVDEPDSELTDGNDAAPAAAPPPPPLIDATLQRAVQLHRALKALKKI